MTELNYKRLCIMGPQGSGKTTQATMLAHEMGLCEIDAGQLLRDRAMQNDDVGVKLQNDMVEGSLVDDSVIASLVKERIEREDCKLGFVMDGYPRSHSQMEAFDPKLDLIVYIEIPDQVVIERMLKRGRVDDTPDGIQKRLSIFHSQTKEILEYYAKEGKLIKVDGSHGIEEVAAEIRKALNEHQS